MAKSYLKRRRNDVVYVMLLLLAHTARRIPRKIGLLLFGWIGRIVYLFPSRDKNRTLSNLRRFYSDSWSPAKIRHTARSVYCNIGKNVFDALYLSRCSNQEFDTIVKDNGLTMFQQAHAAGKGLIAITCHLGCYEMGIHLTARKNIPCVTLGQRLFDSRIDKIVISMRQLNNITYLYRDKSSREVLRHLRQGSLLGVALDQDTYGEGVFAHFLGEPAYTLSGPVRIAMKYDIPLFVAYCARQKDDTHFIFVKKLELEQSDDFDRDLLENIENVNAFISKGILDYPEQWVWMHRRWRKKPDDPRYKDVPNIEKYPINKMPPN